MELKDKVVVVTGASSGIGLAVAHALLALSYQLRIQWLLLLCQDGGNFLIGLFLNLLALGHHFFAAGILALAAQRLHRF